jgi:hypothetical protein
MLVNCNHEMSPAIRATVHAILKNHATYDWSIQGLGMLRLHLSEGVRLHVWDGRFATTDGDSTIHAHPWDFHSFVVSGEVRQQRFTEDPQGLYGFSRVTIRCGCGGGPVAAPEYASLIAHPEERYSAGECYTQEAHEIHESAPTDGTVTLVTRTFKTDTEHAFVYFTGDEWRSAEPRAATREEVAAIVENALAKWITK